MLIYLQILFIGFYFNLNKFPVFVSMIESEEETESSSESSSSEEEVEVVEKPSKSNRIDCFATKIDLYISISLAQ